MNYNVKVCDKGNPSSVKLFICMNEICGHLHNVSKDSGIRP